MTCNECGEKPKKSCGAFPKAVIEIDNPEKIVLLRKVLIPTSMGDETVVPPAIGKYHNVLLEYEASGGIYLYSSDGIPTKLSSDVTELQAQLNALGVRIGEEEVARADADTALSNRITSLDNSLATVARTGSYNDLSDKPTIGNGTLTVKKNGSNVGTFTANATTNTDVNIVVPTKTSDLANDGSDGASQYVESDDLATVATSGSYNDLSNKPTIPAAQVNSDWDATSGVAQILNKPTLATVATSGSYNDLSNKPTIPTVNNATLTIQKNGTTVKTFTANASSNVTANITVPTKTSDITNDSNFVASGDLATVATSGSYNDLSNKPTIPAAQVQSNWTQTTTTAVDYIKNKPTLAAVATSGSYNDLSNKPTIPTVNNATLTIQKNGTNVQTFTANASSDATANIEVPVITMQTTDPGEGVALAANHFIGVYE